MPVASRPRHLVIAATLALLGLPTLADDFVPNDVLVCSAAADVVDPEIEPGGSTMVFNTTSGALRVTRLRADGTLGSGGCKGKAIDSGVITKMPGVPFGQGAEWGRSQTGTEIVYTKGMSDGSSSMWRAWRNGGTWQTAMMTAGESRGLPMASVDAVDPQYRVKYLRRLASGQHVPMWRENELPETETAWRAEGNESSAGVPRWVPGLRALTTASTDAAGYAQAALYWLDTRQIEMLTSDPSNKDEIWMWRAPEFGNEYVFATVVDSCCIRIYRQVGGVWTPVHSIDAPAFAGKPAIFSPEPWVYGGRSYLAMQVGATKTSRSEIWIASIDPAQPMTRRISDSAVDTVRYEPEWFDTADGPVVFFSQYTSSGKSSLRRAATGIR
ncbi:MAG: hypothetical protein HYZ20_14545 [Burkholderiales bacterium]|nr:hypothetical protein [Burkholderiales bacterium]